MSKDLTDALHELTIAAGGIGDPLRQPLPDPKPRGAAPHATAAALLPGNTSGGGGSIASPLTEESPIEREYWPQGWRTTDGLFEFPAIKRVVFFDANNERVEFNFAEPS